MPNPFYYDPLVFKALEQEKFSLFVHAMKLELQAGKVAAKDISFVSDLVKKNKKYGFSTPKQQFYLIKALNTVIEKAGGVPIDLTNPYVPHAYCNTQVSNAIQNAEGAMMEAEKYITPVEQVLNTPMDAPKFTRIPVTKMASIDIGDYAAVMALFSPANKLKEPTLNLVAGERQVRIKRAKYDANNLLVMVNNNTAASCQYYKIGLIQGTNFVPAWQFKKLFDEKGAEDIIWLLMELGISPLETIQKFGYKSGKCSFCNKPLTDEHSLAAGFGPICGKSFNLYNEWKTAVEKSKKETISAA